ncbi:helix-turn-helix transcriptional regulator [Kroppenstedtia pulmonis]|uniref:Helix-turn-helix transcriptional regulator n=1 Tax=Kroppenstedtia pulmonis TaxID=1380685 RepID=A0A7D3Y9S0_9BACL|nr:helix-turn-helix transcriptional regulator [Kroppenstedtia pulmonis]QKG84461.1 helix-turn-helix transcriptional regulator [Kroppenstedtia pulmonis]
MTHVDVNEIGEIIRKVRKEKGLRLEDLADENISPATISNLERGVPHVKHDKLTYLMEKLNIKINQIPDLIMKEHQKLQHLQFNLFAIESLRDNGYPEEALCKIDELDIDDSNPYIAHIHLLKGKCYNSLGKWKKAERAFFNAIRHMNNNHSDKQSNIEAASFTGLSLCSFFQNNLDQALVYTESGLEAFVEDGERSQYKYVLFQNKAMFLEKQGRPIEALKVVQDSWNFLPKIEQIEVILGFYWLRAELLRHTGLYQDAIHYAKEGLEKARFNHEYCRQFDLWTVLGSTYMALKEWDQAESCFELALKLKDRFPNGEILTSAYARLGILYMYQKKWNEAKDAILKAIQKGEEFNDAPRLAYAFIVMGHYYQKRKEFNEAITYYQRSLDLARNHNYRQKERLALHLLAECLEEIDEQEFQSCVRNMYIAQKNIYHEEGIALEKME